MKMFTDWLDVRHYHALTVSRSRVAARAFAFFVLENEVVPTSFPLPTIVPRAAASAALAGDSRASETRAPPSSSVMRHGSIGWRWH
jgi:hypothetical protein